MTKDEILAQPIYDEAKKLFISKSMDFDKAVMDLRNNKDPKKEQKLEQTSKSAYLANVNFRITA